MQSASSPKPDNRFSVQPSHDCCDELVTQHHSKSGHGPVKDTEVVVLAVFQKTNLVNGRVSVETFKKSDFSRSNVSVARREFTSHSRFLDSVVKPQVVSKGALVGVACATTSLIRAIKLTFPKEVPSPYRGACVLDRVEHGDHDGHASIGESEAVQGIKNSNTLGAVRTAILADLADAFGELTTPESVFPL